MKKPFNRHDFMTMVDASIDRLMRIKNLSVVHVAEDLNMQTQQLRRIISSTTGMNSTAYIVNYKITHAKQMLKKYDLLGIAKIADMLGYEEPTHFSRFFKRYTGMTPSEYRQKNNE